MALSRCDVSTNEDRKEKVFHGSPAFPVACYEDDMSRDSVPVHWHDEYEYIAAVKGDVTVLADASQIKLCRGDAIFINSGCLHGVLSVKGSRSVLHSLVVHPKFIGGSTDGIIFQRLVTAFAAKTAPAFVILNEKSQWEKDVLKCMLKAWKVISEEVYDFENEARYNISKAVRIIADHLTDNKPDLKVSDSVLSRVKIALAYIDENYADDINNSDLMRVCGCSESVLLRNFRKAVGLSPMQYLIDFRIQKAAKMLAATDGKSAEIAKLCGFNDFSYFTKMFKKKMGATPIEYRNNVTM